MSSLKELTKVTLLPIVCYYYYNTKLCLFMRWGIVQGKKRETDHSMYLTFILMEISNIILEYNENKYHTMFP
jgi:hypothetical protein